MTESAGAKGGAADATVITVDNTPEALSAALDAARAAEAAAFYPKQVERMRDKVARARGDLATTEDALADAEEQLVAYNAAQAAKTEAED